MSRPDLDSDVPVDQEHGSSAEGSAWKAAESYGCDMSLIEVNLTKTPHERIQAHDRALAMALALRRAMDGRTAGS